MLRMRMRRRRQAVVQYGWTFNAFKWFLWDSAIHRCKDIDDKHFIDDNKDYNMPDNNDDNDVYLKITHMSLSGS